MLVLVQFHHYRWVKECSSKSILIIFCKIKHTILNSHWFFLLTLTNFSFKILYDSQSKSCNYFNWINFDKNKSSYSLIFDQSCLSAQSYNHGWQNLNLARAAPAVDNMETFVNKRPINCEFKLCWFECIFQHIFQHRNSHLLNLA